MLNIKFYCPCWGADTVKWPEFARKVRLAGYDGVEVYPLQNMHENPDMLSALEDEGLEFSLLHSEMVEGKDFGRYCAALKRNLYELANCRSATLAPQFITSQTGREYYTNHQVAECLEICNSISKETGLPIYQETHRNKWPYAAHVVKPYLTEFPDILFAIDFSHWVCVSESYLEDQEDVIDLIVQRAFHIHARVGHIEGPQVTDPRAPENKVALDHHLKWWDKWIMHLRSTNAENCTITPEFGPHPYMSYIPFSNQPLTSQWDINCWMKDLLKARFAG